MIVLSEREREILSRLLDEHSRTLLMEIARADTRDFRERLQAELITCDSLRDRIGHVAEADVYEMAAP